MTHSIVRLRVFGAALALLAAACGSDPDRPSPDNPFRPEKEPREQRLAADELYRLAREGLDSADFAGAIARYQAILTRFPFTDIATQSQLELIYAKYRNYEPDGALTAADRFLKEHPRHPYIDYVHYLKGLINMGRDEGVLDALPLVDAEQHDVSSSRRAFDDFSLLAQKFPDSRYAADARQRMIYLRNRIAEHELHVVRFYQKRGAWVAAAKRAEDIIAQYPGAPGTVEALKMLEKCYRELGLTVQAEEAAKLLAANGG